MIRRRHLLAAGAAASAFAAIGPASAQPRNASWPRAMNMGTAAPGGVYAVYGPGWGALVQEATGIAVSYRATQGPNQNIILVDRKEIELGMTTMGPALQAWNGQGQWTQGNRFRNIRALFPMYDTPFHAIALARSNISRYDQLAGKNIGVGPRAGTPGTYWPAIMQALGIRVAAVRYGSGSDMGGQLGDGLIDAFPFAAGAPIPVFTEMETTNQINFLDFSAEQITKLKQAMPELSDATIPKGTYRTQQNDIKTVGLYNFAICNKDLSADLVYEIVKSVMTNNPRLVAAHATGKETLPQNWNKNAFLPFHPGAARWFRENGHAIPDNLVMA
ncbi:MAG: TAXI family TRAP transporter solute-binding subunit [Alphaproteobacteria bacterium]|nr:TAXI family TRAP transporter solute-binding subunit [Alphaproteobacteria bacterium]